MIRDFYRKWSLKIEHIYFSNKLVRSDADVTRYHQSSYNFEGAEVFSSPIIDLRKSDEEIFLSYRKSTRYEIRKLLNSDSNLKSTHIRSPDDNVIEKFIIFYNKFSEMKGLISVPSADQGMLDRLRNNLIISSADYDGNSVAYHVYIFDESRVRLLYSATTTEKSAIKPSLLAMVNKFLHHQDIIWSKETGFTLYDFGGVALEKKELDGINKFKMGFTKNIEETNDFSTVNTLNGRVATLIEELLK